MSQELIEAARRARLRAYAPYSNFQVGAAIRGAAGGPFAGCNVENGSYGLTLCAERVAACAAVAAGETRFVELAVVSPGQMPPCGACRQFLAEFGGPLRIWLADTDPETPPLETSLEALFPNAFRLP